MRFGMAQHLRTASHCLTVPPGYHGGMIDTRAFPALSALGIFAIYAITMTIAEGFDARHLYSAAVNVAALFACFAIASAILDALAPARRQLAVRVVAHVILAILFTFGWYALVLAGFAIGGGWLRDGVAARAFTENTMVWQLHYGAMMYVMLILYRAWRAERGARSIASPPPGSRPDAEPEHLLLRQGNEMIRISPDEIVRISGAGDYAEIVTRSARYMSTRSLEHFEDTLSPVLLRVHRSHLVRLGAIERTEPAGNGRLQLHLVNRDTVTTSREGGKRLRALVR